MKYARFVVAVLLAVSIAGCETGSHCGDGRVFIPEICDDGDGEPGDGCGADCVTEVGWNCTGSPSVCRMGPAGPICGNGDIDPPEECDTRVATAECDGDCTTPSCGDGYVNEARAESCDDGNLTSGDGCSSTCVDEADRCGNGICDFDEDCVICNEDCAFQCVDCPDFDGDGHQDSACGGDDCNDEAADVHPGALEVVCNRIDEDCSTLTVDALDEDADGSSCNFDCDDDDPDRSPLFLERCGNLIDDDCDPRTDDLGDRDLDGFTCDEECNDFVATICPTCEEVCGNVDDDDCDPSTPDLFDTDEDGFLCNDDCDDRDPNARPDLREICDNGVDDDCDTATLDLYDVDRDGDTCRTDCDDRDPARATTFTETCGNLVDDDCDPLTPDVEDIDLDSVDCVFDCDDDDDAVVPDSDGFCGPQVILREDFEAGPGGWTTSGMSSSWEHGVPVNTFINRAASGTRAWVTNLDGDYRAGEMSFLNSPAFDFSDALTDPVLSFRHIYSTENNFDEGWLEVSTDGGASWDVLGTRDEGQNWYPTASNTWTGTSGGPGAWRLARIVLRGTAGASDVRLRFVMDADSSGQEEGFGVDDVEIDNYVADLAVRSIGLAGATCRNATHPLRVTLANQGSVPATGFTVTYTLDGMTPVAEVVSAIVLPGALHTHTFATPLDLSALGSHALQVRVTILNDDQPANDSLTIPTTVEDVSFIPLGSGYFEDFEAGPGAWISSGLDSSWAYGTPAGTFIPAAASGTRAWVTNLFGDYNNSETARLTSGCFDFSGLTEDPTLSFMHIFEIGPLLDAGYIEVFRASTNTWTILGRRDSGENWYHDRADAWVSTSGPPAAWERASHVLEDTAGESVVRIRHVLSTDAFNRAEGFGLDDVRITLAP